MKFRVNQMPESHTALVWNIAIVLREAGWNLSGWAGPGSLEHASDLDFSLKWFVLQHPAALWSLCFQRGAEGSDWWIKKAATFDLDTGNATISPSGSGEVYLLGSANGAARLCDGPPGEVRAHVVALDSAPYGFWSLAFPRNSRVPCHTLWVDPLKAGSFPAQDPDPYVYYAAGMNLLGPQSFIASARCALTVGTETFGTVEAAVLSLPYSDTIFPSGAGPNPHSGVEDSFPLAYFRRQHYKGLSGMLRWTGSPRTPGTLLTRNTSKDHVVFGNLILPWCGEELRT